MNFLIADTFTASLARLTGDEQKAAKTSAFDLQLNPTSPGLSFHKLDRAKDKNFWSVRVNRDIRIIVHRTDANLVLCYVDHHDDAYHWAERRRLDIHPTTGAAQLVEIRERVEERVVVRPVERPAFVPRPALFAHLSDDELLSYGVPADWLADVRAADEDSLLELAGYLPAEAAEALLELATGGTVFRAAVPVANRDPFAHPDALRRFRVLENQEELAQALEYPWEKWTVFLHPAQREWVERDYGGPARVSGSAGTGKTIVALHRAVHLARQHPDSRVLLATFSPALANALSIKLRCLISHQPRLAERLEIHAMDALGERLYAMETGKPARIAGREQLAGWLQAAATSLSCFNIRFLLSEWEAVVDAWQLTSWEMYRDVRRLGRKTRLSESRRAELWAVFDQVRSQLTDSGLTTHSAIFTELSARIAQRRHPLFDFAVIDEAQDVSVAQLRFLAALGGERPNGLFFAGDLGQRIFQQPFSWKSLGVDIRGRARTLHINYRTSHQIRARADLLLGPEVADVDGNVEERRGTVSVFNGPVPEIVECDSPEAEIAQVRDWLKDQRSEGLALQEIGVIVRSEQELPRAVAAIKGAGMAYDTLDENSDVASEGVSLCTMHLAKGLEFRAVAVMACDDEVIPSQARIQSIGDQADLQEVYDTERHLLYVACTRARDRLLVTSGETPSEFLADIQRP